MNDDDWFASMSEQQLRALRDELQELRETLRRRLEQIDQHLGRLLS